MADSGQPRAAARGESACADAVESFNRNIKILTRDLARRLPGDAMVHRAQKRIMTAIAIDPLYVIGVVGRYLYTYRAQIYDLNRDGQSESFFLGNSYDAELLGADQEKVDMVSYIIPRAKACVRDLPGGEKKQYKDLVIALLDDYVEYLAARGPA